VKETFLIADYVYFVANGVVAAEGTPDELMKSSLPFVHQFVHGEIDGPVPFHYPAANYQSELMKQSHD
jgi:phospholipid/cholesterol/gamma-HCH transport system ATP-binding protein